MALLRRIHNAIATRRRRLSIPRLGRLERFGGIIQTPWPQALVFVDRAFATRVGLKPGKQQRHWDRPEEDGAVGATYLTAPLEAHLQLTNRCSAGCAGCYTAATPKGLENEWGLVEWKRTMDELARLRVFHVALGGGESAILPYLAELARYARDKGVVPNLTTSGLAGLERLLPITHLFGQINVSLDGLAETYRAVRGFDGFPAADKALVRLRERKREVGINVVVTRHNFEEINEIFAYARRRRLNEVELLRFKPAGRGADTFSSFTCSDAQHRAFLPTVLSAAKRYRIRVRVDCSYTPMIAHHSPAPALLASLSVYGCSGGDFLIGAKATGELTACSFAAPPMSRPKVDQLGAYWTEPTAFGAFRTWEDASAPCNTCSYLKLCRGGCRVVSAHVHGDAARPDPECPRVVDWQARSNEQPESRLRLPVLR